MVEREALLPGDRPKIAAVIYNRLRLGMALGIDATIRYAVDSSCGPDFSGDADRGAAAHRLPLQHAHARRPAADPDQQPGVAAIEAAAHPAHVLLPVLRQRRGRLRGPGVLDQRAEFEPTPRPTGSGDAQRRARTDVQEAEAVSPAGARRAARRRRCTEHPGDPSRRARLARGAQPLAGDAQRRAARAGPRAAVELPAAAGAPGAVRGDGPRARRRRLPRGRT